MKLLRNIFRLIGEARKYFLPIVLFVFGMELFRIAQTELFARMITQISNGLVLSGILLSWWAIYYALYWLSDAGADKYVINKLAADVERSVPVLVLKHLFTLPLKFFNDVGTDTIALRVNKGTDGLKWILMTVCWSLISSFTQTLLASIYLSIILWQWGVVLVATVGVFTWFTVSLNKVKAPRRKRRYDLYEIKKHLLQQLMHNIAIVKAFGQEDHEVSVCEGVCEELKTVSIEEMTYEIRFNLLRGLCIIIGLGGMLVIGYIARRQGLIELGSIVGTMSISIACLLSLYRLGWVFVEISDHHEGVSRLVRILTQDPEVLAISSSPVVANLAGDVVFENVHFAYPNGGGVSQDCLIDLNFSVEAGETVALVGRSGSGKTTLINLILRFMNPTRGKIRVGGRNICELDLESYRDNLSVVLQTGELFSGRTIAENIAVGLPTKDISVIEPLIWKALEDANAADFVRARPKGIHTVVSEHASNLSGGERQRITIARALVRHPIILLLDEATSSLDTKNERDIQEALNKLGVNTTVFVIAHRLSTVRNADKIFVLEAGRIVQRGTHEELMQISDGLYAGMIGAQAV